MSTTTDQRDELAKALKESIEMIKEHNQMMKETAMLRTSYKDRDWTKHISIAEWEIFQQGEAFIEKWKV